MSNDEKKPFIDAFNK